MITSLLRSIVSYFTSDRLVDIPLVKTTSIYTTIKKANKTDKVKTFLDKNSDNSFIEALDSVTEEETTPPEYFEMRI